MRKTFVILAVISAAAFTLAQTPVTPLKGRHPHRIPANQSNKDVRQGMKLAHQAHQLLASALPVYQGARVDAMIEVRVGNKELGDALKGISVDPTTGKLKLYPVKHGKGSKLRDGQSRSKYPADQVASSDAKLRQASTLLAQAIVKLDTADPMYHGERVEAIAKFKAAQGYIAQALAIR